MRNILVEINCKKCFYHTHIKSHTLVMAELEPQLKKRILEHTLFTYRCPRCGSEITYLHNFLYHDKQHLFLIYMSQETKDLSELKEQFPNWKLCRVDHPLELVEKIHILEDGLDDQVIAVCKEKLKARYPKGIILTYQDSDEQGNLWFQYQDNDTYDMKGIPYGFYQKLKKSFK